MAMRVKYHWKDYTPARNYCEINSKNTISCNWNGIFQEKIPKRFFHVIGGVMNEYVICNSEINSGNNSEQKIFLVTEM